MKLGIFMLVVGLILAGIGVATFIYADPNMSFWGATIFNVEEAQMVNALGIGATVVGGGLAVGGIIRMILKR